VFREVDVVATLMITH